MMKRLIAISITAMALLGATSISAQNTATIGSLGASPGAVDLTALGNLDWVYLGYDALADANLLVRKDITTPLIEVTALTDIANPDGDTGPDIVWEDTEPYGNPFSWTDGTPTATGTDVESSWWMAGVGNGFEITAPVTATPQYLAIYAGIWYSIMKLTVSIDGVSLDSITAESRALDADDGNVDRYNIAFSGDAGSVLKAEWIIAENLDDAFGGWGNGPLRAVVLTDAALTIEPNPEMVPMGYALGQNYPNPFNPTTTLDFTLGAAGAVKMVLYDLKGHKVRTLVDAPRGSGSHSVTWDGRDDGGNQLPSGIYFYRLTAGSNTWTKKMMFLK